MALIQCKECKAQVSSDAKTCPQCGAKVPKKTSLFAWLMAGIAGVVVYSCIGGQQMADSHKEKAASVEAAKASAWAYKTEKDVMTSKPTRSASLKSVNSLELAFPYAGPNSGELYVRQIDGKSDKVIFSIDKGQTLCNSYAVDCQVQVRFDDAQPITFSGQAPSDGATTHVFLSPASKFIVEAKKAKHIKVSLTIYQNGTQMLDFNSSAALNW